jgi:response regulator NasT
MNSLIISNSENSVAFIKETLKAIDIRETEVASNGDKARKRVKEHNFALCIINSPLSDESGESMAVQFADMCQVILIVRKDYYEEISSHVEDSGVITVAKPIDRVLFKSAVKLAKAAHSKVERLKTENSKLVRRIEDIRLINRAKFVLISHLSMSENEAHKYIEKQAMDTRINKRAIAEGILRTYEN